MVASAIQQEHAAVENLVNGTDKRMRAISGYRNRLRMSARAVLDHVNALVDSLPGAINADPEEFASNPHLNSFFVSRDHLQETFTANQLLQHFNRDPASLDSAQTYMVLLMAKKIKTVFANALIDDQLVSDVRQTSVSFTAHQVDLPAASEADVRHLLKQKLFDQLVSRIRLHMTRLQSEQTDVDPINNLKNPEFYLQQLSAILTSPEQLLRMQNSNLKISRTGMLLDEQDRQAANELSFSELYYADEEPRVVQLVSYPRMH